MNINNLFQTIHSPIKYDELIPFTLENYETFKNEFQIKYTFNEIIETLESVNLNPGSLYMSLNSFYRFWYMGEFAHVEVVNLDKKTFELLQITERIKTLDKTMKEMWEKQEYEPFFALLPTQFQFDFLMKHLYDFPQRGVYELFRTIYVQNEYGFQDLDKQKIYYIFSLNARKGFLRKLSKDSSGYVTIFRGMTNASTSVKEAYSWTTSLETALFFATRFSSFDGKVFQARIHQDKVIDYIMNRGESEILVCPENLVDVKDMKFLSIDSRPLKTSAFKNYIAWYNHYKERGLNPDWFNNPNGIHGMLHTKRVMFLITIMAYLEKLSHNDFLLLMYCAIMHDIGRTSDLEDDKHGYMSVEKIKKLGLLDNAPFSSESVEIIKSIIKYHSLSDKKGFANISQNGAIEEKSKAMKLYSYFKDADGLDRVRLSRKGDLDISYLRNSVSKRLPIVAYQLLKYLR